MQIFNAVEIYITKGRRWNKKQMHTISRKYYYSTVTSKCILLGIIRYFNRFVQVL